MMRVIERETGLEFNAEAIDGGFQVFTLDGEKYKKLRESTFKKYFKMTGSPVKNNPEESDDKREKMIEKVKKMMALAQNNPSQEEALAAALQAQKLMAKYNIHEEDISLEEVKEEIGSVQTEQKHDSSLHKWRVQLALVVGKNFRCKVYKNGQDIVFRGYKADADLANDVYLMLYLIGDKLGSKAYKEALKQGSGKGVYNSVTLGFYEGVRDALNKQCTALMIVTPKEVEEEFAEFSKNFKKSKASLNYNNIDGELFNKGYQEGRNAVAARGIEG